MNRRHSLIATALLPFPALAGSGFMDWYNGVTLGTALPDFDTEYLTDAPATDRKLTLIDFWATWCAPCREEFPHLNQLNRALAPQGLVVIGLTQEPTAVAKAFLPKANFQYPVGAGGSKPLQQRLGIKALPYAILVDRHNTIMWRGQARSLATVELEQMLKRAA